MALGSGTKLNSYEIQSPLGAGGMGEAYRGRDDRIEGQGNETNQEKKQWQTDEGADLPAGEW
jgi:hypothetical protein